MFRTIISTCVLRSRIVTSELICSPLATCAGSCLSVYQDHISKAVLFVNLLSTKSTVIMAKRKGHSTLAQERPITSVPIPVTPFDDSLPLKRRASQRSAAQVRPEPGPTNPDTNPNILDGAEAVRASPDAEELDERAKVEKVGKYNVKKDNKDNDESDSPLSDLSNTDSQVKAGKSKSNSTGRVGSKSGVSNNRIDPKTAVHATTIKQQPPKGDQFLDPEADGDEEADEEEMQAALSRPPPVNSDYLPLPWKGRLGYVRPDFSIASFANSRPGLFMYVSALFKSASLQLSNLPHCIHPRKSTSSQRSQ